MSIDNKRLSGQIRGVSPCTGCTERFRACWDHCQKYKAWKNEIKRVKKAREEYLKRNAKKYISYGGNEDG